MFQKKKFLKKGKRKFLPKHIKSQSINKKIFMTYDNRRLSENKSKFFDISKINK